MGREKLVVPSNLGKQSDPRAAKTGAERASKPAKLSSRLAPREARRLPRRPDKGSRGGLALAAVEEGLVSGAS